jgi:hypothetical protein
MATEVFVYQMTSIGGVGAWSRYLFPFDIQAFARLGEDLYIRAGDDVLKLSRAATGFDFVGDSRQQEVVGTVQWPWLEFGQFGRLKRMIGFDVVADGRGTVSFGTDQSNLTAFTSGVTVPADTVPGMLIPMPLMAPSISAKVTFEGDWQLKGLNVHLVDQRMGA